MTPTRDRYDAIVIGAGPAGAVAARELARRGQSVLMVDKATFPRRKVCGCCLNGNALAALAAVGLGELPHALGAVPLHSLKLAAGGRMATVPLAGVALSREAFDVALIGEAVKAGVEFRPGCRATMGAVAGDGRTVGVEFLAGGGRKPLVELEETGGLRPPLAKTLRAGVVLVADGLNGRTAASADGFDVPAKSSSRIGAGTVVTVEGAPPPGDTCGVADLPHEGGGVERGVQSPMGNSLLNTSPLVGEVERRSRSGGGPFEFYRPGFIFMATGGGGYVGLVVLEDGRLDIAAAFDPPFVRAAGGLGEAATLILADAGFPAIPTLRTADWKGTPALTRTPDRIAGERWFAVGDASGYVEPFTGEGMAWAVGGAAAAARLVADGWNSTLPEKWRQVHNRLVGRRQRFCRLLAPALRSRAIRSMMVSALRVLPVLASPFVRGLNRPPRLAC